jgi:hypothetical protein
MSRPGSLVLALAMLTVARPAPAQESSAIAEARDRAKLARADSLYANLMAQRAERQANRRGYLVRSGDLNLIFWEAVPRSLGRQLGAGAGEMLREFGAVPEGFVRRSVVVQVWAVDTAGILAAPALRGSRRVWMEWPQPADTTAVSWRIASRLAAAYRETLDSAWQAWLPQDYGVQWERAREGQAALNALTLPREASGSECLAGKPAECRLWLGVDPDEHPYASRYRPAELRSIVQERSYDERADADRSSCLNGADDACLRLVERQRWLSPIPAPDPARVSLIRAVHALHGAEALRSALADTAGGIGERLARASGISEDSVVAEWRTWVLSRGRPQRVRAGFGDALPVLALVGLVLFAAARSGRWR